jgi:hypothetical protein
VPKRRANPLAWVVLGVVLLLFVLLVKAIGGRDTYRAPALTLAQQTSKLGQEFAALRTQVKTLDRLELFRRMRAWERQARGELSKAEDLSTPHDYRRAGGYLMTALGLRADGLRRFDPAVRNALSDRDIQVSVSQLANVMSDLVLADRAYALFRGAWPAKVERPPVSSWVGDPDQASIDGVTSFVRELRKQDALAAVYNLAISSVSVDPKPTGKDRDADAVPFTKSLSVSVLIENTGNQVISSAPIVVVLTSETDPVPQTVEGQVPIMHPKDRKSIVLKGLEPTSGAINLLRVTVGPVGNERNTLDNTVEYKFAMRKP